MGTILITGGHGYIGSHAVYAFLDAGYQVVVVDNYSAGVRVSFPDNVHSYEGDIGEPAFIHHVLDEVQPEAVIHFAGSVIVPESVLFPEKYYRNNTLASLCLIQACLRHHVHRFVFSSTAAVYGIPLDGIATETSPTQPINPYGQSKLMVEQILADIAKAHDFHYAALRYFNVAGADHALRTGQSTPQATHLIKVICEVAAGVRDRMDIFGTDYDTPDGTCLRDYIHVSDLASAHLAVLDYITRHKQNAVFNCGNGRGFSVREVIAMAQGLIASDILAFEAPRRQGDPPRLIADASLIRSKTNWQAEWSSVEDMIKTALAWEKKRLVLT